MDGEGVIEILSIEAVLGGWRIGRKVKGHGALTDALAGLAGSVGDAGAGGGATGKEAMRKEVSTKMCMYFIS